MKTKIMLFALIFTVALVAGCVSNTNKAVPSQNTSIKEFSMDSFYIMENGKPHPQFSLNEITVNRGDRVRIQVNTINGTHNFNIDEFNVHADTPTGKITTIEFTADKQGDFVYYCSMPNHRANGHWATLKVL
jgi:heme/copper-type cytochrome/quinol oxidase subunit 2